MATPQEQFLSKRASDIAGLIVKHHKTSSRLMVDLLTQIFTDIGGKDYSPSDNSIAKVARKLLYSVMVQPGRISPGTFNAYFTWGRKCMIFGVTWAQAQTFHTDDIREAARRARAKLDEPSASGTMKEVIAQELEIIKRENRETSRAAKAAAKRGPGPLTLKPVTTPASARKWVKQIGQTYATFDLTKLPSDEEGKLVRNFIAACVALQERRRQPKGQTEKA